MNYLITHLPDEILQLLRIVWLLNFMFIMWGWFAVLMIEHKLTGNAPLLFKTIRQLLK